MIPDLLLKAAEEVKKIDEQIGRMAKLADYNGSLRISIPTFQANGEWEGKDDTVCGAVNSAVGRSVESLKIEKQLLLDTLAAKIKEEG